MLVKKRILTVQASLAFQVCTYSIPSGEFVYGFMANSRCFLSGFRKRNCISMQLCKKLKCMLCVARRISSEDLRIDVFFFIKECLPLRFVSNGDNDPWVLFKCSILEKHEHIFLMSF